MKRLILQPLARKDIRAIWRYGIEIWGEAKSDNYIRDMNRFLTTLAEYPGRGQGCDDLRPGYLKAVFMSHIVFYTVAADRVTIIRILHQSMDHQRYF